MPFITPTNFAHSGASPLVQVVGVQAERLGITDGGIYTLRVIKKIATNQGGGTSWLVGINGKVIRTQSDVPLSIGDNITVGASLRGKTVFLHILANTDGTAAGGRAASPNSVALSWNSLQGYIVAAAQRSGFAVPRSLLERLHRTVVAQQGATHKDILPSMGALIERGLFPYTVNALWYFKASTETFGRGHREGRRWQRPDAHKASVQLIDSEDGDDTEFVLPSGVANSQHQQHGDSANHGSHYHSNSEAPHHHNQHSHNQQGTNDYDNSDPRVNHQLNQHLAHRQPIPANQSVPLPPVFSKQAEDIDEYHNQSYDTTQPHAEKTYHVGQQHAAQVASAIRTTQHLRYEQHVQQALHNMKVLQNHILPLAQSGVDSGANQVRNNTGHWVLLPFTMSALAPITMALSSIQPSVPSPSSPSAQTQSVPSPSSPSAQTQSVPSSVPPSKMSLSADTVSHQTKTIENMQCSGELHLHYHPTTSQCVEGIMKCTIDGHEIEVHISLLNHSNKNIFVKTNSTAIARELSARHQELLDAYRRRHIDIKSIQCINVSSNQPTATGSTTTMNAEHRQSI